MMSAAVQPITVEGCFTLLAVFFGRSGILQIVNRHSEGRTSGSDQVVSVIFHGRMPCHRESVWKQGFIFCKNSRM